MKQWLMCAACEHDVLSETAGLSALSSYKSSTLVLTQKEVADTGRADRMTGESLSLSPALSLSNTSILLLLVTVLTVLLPRHQFHVISSHF